MIHKCDSGPLLYPTPSYTQRQKLLKKKKVFFIFFPERRGHQNSFGSRIGLKPFYILYLYHFVLMVMYVTIEDTFDCGMCCPSSH